MFLDEIIIVITKSIILITLITTLFILIKRRKQINEMEYKMENQQYQNTISQKEQSADEMLTTIIKIQNELKDQHKILEDMKFDITCIAVVICIPALIKLIAIFVAMVKGYDIIQTILS